LYQLLTAEKEGSKTHKVPPMANVIKLSIRALILEETLLKKGFFQAIFPKLLKVLGNRDPLWRGFKGKTFFQKGFPFKVMTLPPMAGGGWVGMIIVKIPLPSHSRQGKGKKEMLISSTPVSKNLARIYNPRIALAARSVGGVQGAGETGGIVVGGVTRGGSIAGGRTSGFRYEIKAELANGTLVVSQLESVGAREE
jgi:hypothetical protein